MKISIIIPAYNAEKTIKRAVESCKSFKKNLSEIIVIDDCSTDNTFNVLKKLELELDNIKIFKNNTNKGVSYSRNFGVNMSSGEYCIFLDSDDYYLGNAGVVVHNEISRSEYDVYCFGYIINGKSSPKPNVERKLYLEFFDKKFSNTNTIVSSKAVLEANKFREDFKIGEDTDLWFRLLCKCKSKYVDKNIAYYDYCPKINDVDEHPVLKLSLYEVNIPELEKTYIRNKVTNSLLLRGVFSRRLSIKKSFQHLGMKGVIFWLGGEYLFSVAWKFKHGIKNA
ncbi:glycosyltransferase family 2 protein [Vibrio parahaemolyticus]|uniref:glycosyltransferase family 2 protein n=1 Tax=Vibrio parahaemolyticus TaxID=670 RepID=UPI0006B270F0|nr:glycosyltransferase family 2 protein [Vibrio parahaemolyticus]KOY31192.1 hypothetical protein ACX08_16395 [Vibrio parahaemolyticus]MCR9873212.1 glycosyltransferase [Vibrio parahaemolyticus]